MREAAYPNRMADQRKAVALISGGLDSMLAAKVIMEQGVHVEGLNFFTGFCVEGHTHAIRKRGGSRRNNALWVAEQLGIKLHLIDVVQEYKNVVLDPRHGYGANLNPCLDCKSFMVGKALAWLEKHRFDFVVTGEVIGQRPMSQRKNALPVIARESGANDRLLRPLCAQSLPQTLPEREGWIDVAKLPRCSGRSRKPQMALAKEYGFTDYAQPAGGCCFLTNRYYATKLRDLWEHRGRRDYELDDIMLLKVGRHLRPRPHYKVIIAREEGENRFLSEYRREFVQLHTLSHAGPVALIDGGADAADFELAARLTARYSQGRDSERVEVEISYPDGKTQRLNVSPLAAEEVPAEWHV